MRALTIARVVLVLLPGVAVARTDAPIPLPLGVGQEQPPEGRGDAPGRGAPGQGRGPNFPQQQRKLADAAVLAKGKGLYESNCAACHGIDLRGGQQGGPNLLRSQTILSDKAGELVAPIVRGGRPNPPAGMPPMPPFQLAQEDIVAVAEYLHSVLAQAGNQGRPPAADVVTPEKVLVGDATAGQAYFNSRCGSCHSLSEDLRGVASRVPDPRELQNLWVSGGGGGGRGGRGGNTQARPRKVTVTTASGARVEGRLARIDDFIVSVILEDGTRRTFVRNGSDPKVEVSDPAAAHRTLVSTLNDRDMHNVTAYLWTVR